MYIIILTYLHVQMSWIKKYHFVYALSFIYLRSIAKQVIAISITLDISFQMVSIFVVVVFRGERSQTCPYMLIAKQGSIWYHFYNVVGMAQSGIESATSRSRGKRSLGETFNHRATAEVLFYVNALWWLVQHLVLLSCAL